MCILIMTLLLSSLSSLLVLNMSLTTALTTSYLMFSLNNLENVLYNVHLSRTWKKKQFIQKRTKIFSPYLFIITIIVNTESCKYVVATGVLGHDDYQRSEGVTVLGDYRLQVTTALFIHHLQQGRGHQGVLGVQPQDVGVLDVLFQFVLPL